MARIVILSSSHTAASGDHRRGSFTRDIIAGELLNVKIFFLDLEKIFSSDREITNTAQPKLFASGRKPGVPTLPRKLRTVYG
jgi:hypothetical protein